MGTLWDTLGTGQCASMVHGQGMAQGDTMGCNGTFPRNTFGNGDRPGCIHGAQLGDTTAQPLLSPTSPTGHRCFKAIMFTSGLLLGSGTIFLLCYKERVLETRLSLEVSAGIALAIGALCGLVTALLRSVGLFSTGLLLGLLLATVVLAAAAPLVPPLSPWVLVGVLLGPALLCALLALRWPKALTMLATAVLGAAVVVVCVDYFVEVFALVLHVSERLRMAEVGQLCWYSWVVLGVWPALSLLENGAQEGAKTPTLPHGTQRQLCPTHSPDSDTGVGTAAAGRAEGVGECGRIPAPSSAGKGRAELMPRGHYCNFIIA
uniref:Transmembrane protein 198 n=1 Tax=Pavo cristatus TaxID=9049 RepID=A0A8C9FYC9_PAVCR